MAEDPKLIALRYSIPLVEELMNDKMELQRDGIRMMDNISEMANTMKTQEKYIKNLEEEKKIRDLEMENYEQQIENNEKRIDNYEKQVETQEWMIKSFLLQLKDTIITKNKKVAAWRSFALKYAPKSSGIHKFANEKDVPEFDEEFLAVINDILKKQKTGPGVRRFSEYANNSESPAYDGKAAFDFFLTKQKTVTEAGAEPKVEKKTTNWKNNFQNPTSWTLGTYFVISLLIWFLFK
ncbi:hypothetical protein B9Z55_023394 [Caenorhabditis nigoni]|uniref:Uncharacterized protein n=1 Tax=Caenorhabditis nigoni TaxID=1611254 RepID=A0A2G5SPJ5_9PELO|nr:hypothetical protein B9Z55_023394 [Caenorhabditis nigoni]